MRAFGVLERRRAYGWALGLGLYAASGSRVGTVEAKVTSVCAPGTCGAIAGKVVLSGGRGDLAGSKLVVLRGDELGPNSEVVAERLLEGDGAFLVRDVPLGVYTVVVVGSGVDRYEVRWLVVRSTSDARRTLFVRPSDATRYRTVVRSRFEPLGRAPTSQRMSREELASVPGTLGDPLRGLQALPGMGRTPGGLGLLVIRGAPPSQSAVFLGEHPIPRAFHVFGFTSVFAAGLIESLDYVPGNFESRYGNATAGIIVVNPRVGRRDGFHGHADLGLMAMGAQLEGPVGKGSFAIAAQRSHLDLGFRAVNRWTDSSALMVPGYWDYQSTWRAPLRSRSTLDVRFFGAADRILQKGLNYETGEREELFEFKNEFHRVDLVLRSATGPWRFLLTPSGRYDGTQLEFAGETVTRTRHGGVFSFRAEMIGVFSRRFTWRIGTDALVDGYRVKRVTPDFQEPPPRPVTEDGGTYRDDTIAVYTDAQLALGPVTLRPGVRLAAFQTAYGRGTATDPRLTATVQLHEDWRLHAGVGAYSQAFVLRDVQMAGVIPGQNDTGDGTVLVPASLRALFEPQVALAPVRVNVGVARAWHASVSMDYAFGDAAFASLTGFVRDQTRGVPPSLGGEALVDARSRTYGLEALVRKPLTRRFFGWIAYTLLRSEGWWLAPGSRERDGEVVPGAFDQRHNLAVLGSYKLPRAWRIGFRFRLVSGSPMTPIIGAVRHSTVSGYARPVEGRENSERLPIFHQLDLRLDKEWFVRRTSVMAYFDVQNAYNHANTEVLLYSYDYRQSVGQVGLPIFPSLGLRVTW